jgi:hypothetical protein
MKRVAMTGDDSGKWFDRDAAVEFKEQTQWNGNNHISRATGSQWDHESLYYTRSGRWVLCHWSQWQGSLESYVEVSLADAVAWLIENECLRDDGYDALPTAVRAAVDAGVEAVEV